MGVLVGPVYVAWANTMAPEKVEGIMRTTPADDDCDDRCTLIQFVSNISCSHIL